MKFFFFLIFFFRSLYSIIVLCDDHFQLWNLSENGLPFFGLSFLDENAVRRIARKKGTTKISVRGTTTFICISSNYMDQLKIRSLNK